jgi:hypothetical protein
MWRKDNMRINNDPKSAFSKTAVITLNRKRGGYVVKILNNDYEKLGGLVAPSRTLGIYIDKDSAIKAVRESCASFARACEICSSCQKWFSWQGGVSLCSKCRIK